MINLKRNGSKYLNQKFIKKELNGEDFRAWKTLTGLKTSEVSFLNARTFLRIQKHIKFRHEDLHSGDTIGYCRGGQFKGVKIGVLGSCFQSDAAKTSPKRTRSLS